jgi:ferredoxin
VRVSVDRLLCEANAICLSHAPEVFDLDDDDEIHLLQEEPPESMRDQVEQAARSCPKQAITVDG